MKRYKLEVTVFLFLLMVLFICSCVSSRPREDLYSDAAEELVEVIENSGYEVDNHTTELDWQTKSICIYVEDYSDEKAEEIFNTCIFPYMSSNNSVIRKLLNESVREPQIVIVVFDGSNGEENVRYSSNIDSLFEKWENNESCICLEEYR